MSEFVLTPAAEDDIREILDYIERDNPSVGKRVSDALRHSGWERVPAVASGHRVQVGRCTGER